MRDERLPAKGVPQSIYRFLSVTWCLEGPEAGDRYRSCHALELALAQLLDLGHSLGRSRQAAAHQHLAVRSLGAQARRQVDDGADRRVEAVLEADAAQGGVALR